MMELTFVHQYNGDAPKRRRLAKACESCRARKVLSPTPRGVGTANQRNRNGAYILGVIIDLISLIRKWPMKKTAKLYIPVFLQVRLSKFRIIKEVDQQQVREQIVML